MKSKNIVAVKDRIREIMDEYAEKRRAEEEEKQKALLRMMDDDGLSVHKEHLKTTFV